MVASTGLRKWASGAAETLSSPAECSSARRERASACLVHCGIDVLRADLTGRFQLDECGRLNQGSPGQGRGTEACVGPVQGPGVVRDPSGPDGVGKGEADNEDDEKQRHPDGGADGATMTTLARTHHRPHTSLSARTAAFLHRPIGHLKSALYACTYARFRRICVYAYSVSALCGRRRPRSGCLLDHRLELEPHEDHACRSRILGPLFHLGW